MSIKREDLEAAGRAVGEEMALSLRNVGMNLDSKSWEKFNAARKARRGQGRNQVGSAANAESGQSEPLSGKVTKPPAPSTTAHRTRHDPMDEAMAEFGADDDAAAARARMAGSGAGRKRVVPDMPALSTPRPINGTLVSGMDTNVVTVPGHREGALKSGPLIKKYIESGRDVTLHTATQAGTVSITDFKPGSTMVFRYDGMRKVATLKVPNMTKPWDGTEEGPKPKAQRARARAVVPRIRPRRWRKERAGGSDIKEIPGWRAALGVKD
jgi:hypothetical protein